LHLSTLLGPKERRSMSTSAHYHGHYGGLYLSTVTQGSRLLQVGSILGFKSAIGHSACFRNSNMPAMTLNNGPKMLTCQI